ncbi:MAG: hypothetical protein FJ026_06930 [Chloroflexi bacterium]|nr:hypothetical protein [Chloroflexota bacterium]
MKSRPICLLCALFLIALLLPAVVQAQEPQLTLRLRRDFGYGGFAGEIQGVFRLLVSGPQDLQRVSFFLDGQLMGEVSQAPFELLFTTDQFAPGSHTLVAVGYTAGGLELRSNEVHSYFLTSEEAGRATGRLIIGLLGGVGGLMALAFLITSLLSRGKQPSVEPGQPRQYGLAGGAICPRCRRPFSRNWWSPNLVLGKLERCPFCGKYSLVQRASTEALAAAEAAELQTAGTPQEAPALTEEERLRRALEDSRFRDA